MEFNDSKELPVGMEMQCYACQELPATHVCRYQIDELTVQVCLCKECMKIDTEDLIKNTIGLKEPARITAQDYLAF
jgi:protein-arginine kinase activator protein McsA